MSNTYTEVISQSSQVATSNESNEKFIFLVQFEARPGGAKWSITLVDIDSLRLKKRNLSTYIMTISNKLFFKANFGILKSIQNKSAN